LISIKRGFRIAVQQITQPSSFLPVTWAERPVNKAIFIISEGIKG
jgi:hypothetical protein